MTRINEHSDTLSDLKQQPHRHSSETARSRNDAGGEVPVDQYRKEGGQRDSEK
jgi:hypothetical protein